MNLKQFFKYFFIHSIVLTVLFLLHSLFVKGQEMYPVIIVTLFYIPCYVFIFSGLNLMLIWLGLKKIKKRPLVFLSAFFICVLLVFFRLIEVVELMPIDFIIFNIVIILLNLLTIAKLTSNKQ